MKEACAVFAIFAPNKEIARLTYFGLFVLQHRGQESSGISVTDGKKITTFKKMGLVSQVFDEDTIEKLTGIAAIGHNRYGTTGGSVLENAQPFQYQTNLGPMALAHNGNLSNTEILRKKILASGHSINSSSDTEIIAKMIYSNPQKNWSKKITEGVKELKGAFTLVILTQKKIYGVRDPWGIRPLVLGKLNSSGYILASESCALPHIGATFVRDIKPGEIISIDKNGPKTVAIIKQPQTSFCIFEYVYFARADSVLNGRSVYQSRTLAGKLLASEHPVKADYVISVPDSGTTAAIGFSLASKIPYVEGLLKNRYIGRTFIQPGDKLRKLGVRLKFSPVADMLQGKSVVVVDDSIVRGTTLHDLIKVLKKAGVGKVHLRIASPALKNPCFLGVDIEQHKELIANKRTIEQIRQKIGADSLGYLSLDGLKKSVGKLNTGFCTGCFSGEYPLQIEK